MPVKKIGYNSQFTLPPTIAVVVVSAFLSVAAANDVANPVNVEHSITPVVLGDPAANTFEVTEETIHGSFAAGVHTVVPQVVGTSSADKSSADTLDPDDLGDDDDLDALLDQDLATLRRTSVAPALDVEVSSVSRQKSTVGRSPAAIFVITSDMIRHSGVRTVPEALRMVPGLTVARIDANKWSISSRGDTGRYSDSLLVQVDGRTVYTPLFAGVYWDSQDLLLDDILRIEVIRGPGATVWGANAVNGVINIITKPASQTHGVYGIAGGGTVEESFTGARVSGRTESGVDWRVSGKWFSRDDFELATGRAFDRTNQGRTSFRFDWDTTCCDSFTLQGDYFEGKNRSAVLRDFGYRSYVEPVSGGNVLGRWTRKHSQDSESSLQFFYDRVDRLSDQFLQQINTFDLDFQNRMQLAQRHSLIWGLGYRNIFDDLTRIEESFQLGYDPEKFTVERISAFLQDEVTLLEDQLYLTLGSKFSYNTLTQFEVQPTARLLMLPSETSATWCSFSRAVRVPSRTSENGSVYLQNTGVPFYLQGNDSLESEELYAFEFGYRRQTTDRFSWDVATYFHHYEELHSFRLAFDGGVPFADFYNGGDGDAYGIEFSAQAKLTDCWNLRGWYSWQRYDFDVTVESLDDESGQELSLPRNQAHLASQHDLGGGKQFDLTARYVDNIAALSVPAYIELDARFAWQIRPHVEVTVVGRNLIDSSHLEYGTNIFTGDVVSEIPRSVHAYLEWRR